uniref:Pyrin domain-containing protein n=1 Tax=Salarias fasciatus TaxID=181472 RepID=A0A672HNA2_SALFA
MSSTPEVVLGMLDDLMDEDFKRFKWYLCQDGALKGFKPIPKSKLESLDRIDTVDKLVQTYSSHALEVMKMVLEKMYMTHIWEKHTRNIFEPEGKSWKHENLMVSQITFITPSSERTGNNRADGLQSRLQEHLQYFEWIIDDYTYPNTKAQIFSYLIMCIESM